MKLCKDCKWIKLPMADWWSFNRCQNPQLHPNPITGEILNSFCDRLREQNSWWNWKEKDYCGPEGKWWEAKED